MAESLNGLKRTCLCGELTAEYLNKEVVVFGFTAKIRNMGGLIFIDLRDRTGIIQLVADNNTPIEILDKAASVKNEYVLAAKGILRKRQGAVNTKISTGEFEILINDLRILSEAETTPFVIDEKAAVLEPLRLKYRYLELRRPELQKNLIVRDKITKTARDYLSENGFLEIETPFLGKSTPEGARDYLVPSRVHPGSFYALPQSPQLYKQLLMIAGFDRYYQVARCFRDEDLRANRQPEFTQIDMEMSYVEKESDVMEVMEGLVCAIFEKTIAKKLPRPFRTITYKEAMEKYGSDKPDTRFGMEIQDVSDIVANSEFSIFSGAVKNGGSVRLINANGFQNRLSRKEIDALSDIVKTFKAKGLAWMSFFGDEIKGTVVKNLSKDEIDAIKARSMAQSGDILFFVADKNSVVFNSLGALRLHLAEKAGLIDNSKFDILWVTDFPLLEFSEEENRFVAVHHPFTMPKQEDIALLDTNPEAVRAAAYDLVINGQEAGGGSIRIHDRELQAKMFNLLGFTDEDIEAKFGFFVNAFKYGAPPHGGLAFGLDRLVMLLTGTESIKDVIAFPKVQNASCLMSDAPSQVDIKQLNDLHILIDKSEKNG